jgi:hypothetical protein
MGVMCGAAVMPPKELLKAFEPQTNVIWAEWHELGSRALVELFSNSKKPMFVLVEAAFSRDPTKVSEVTLTVNGEKSIIKRKWGVSPTT